jgi:flagellar FliJ protein
MQNILTLKETLERQQKAAFSLAMLRVREEEEKLQQLLLRRGKYESDLAAASEGTLDLKEITHIKSAIQIMKTLIRDQMFELKKAQDALEVERKKLDQIMMERKTYEKLREKAFEEFKHELVMEDMKVTDEFTSFKYNKTQV